LEGVKETIMKLSLQCTCLRKEYIVKKNITLLNSLFKTFHQSKLFLIRCMRTCLYYG